MHLGSIQISLIEPKDSYELGNLITNRFRGNECSKNGTAYATPIFLTYILIIINRKEIIMLSAAMESYWGEVGIEIFRSTERCL